MASLPKHPRIYVTGRNLSDLMPLLQDMGAQIVEDNPDLVISYGGDGSLLGAEQRFPGTPKLALRDARQNPKCPLHSERSILQQMKDGTLDAGELFKLQAETDSGYVQTGINDIVISRQLISSAIRYRIFLNGKLFRPQVVADSLVIATPFGSTGYFQSITHGNFQTGLGIAFNNSMDLYGHTVVSADTHIDIELLRGPAVLVADNNPQIERLEAGDVIHIAVLPTPVTVYGIEAFRCADCYALRKNGL